MKEKAVGKMVLVTPLTALTPSVIVPDVQNELATAARYLDQTILKLENELRRARNARAALGDVEPESTSPAKDKERGPRKAGSIGDHMMSILREAGPLTVKAIHEQVSAKGKLVDYHTLSSTVAYYKRRGYLARTAPGTYGIAKGAPMPHLTNGAPLPKNGVP